MAVKPQNPDIGVSSDPPATSSTPNTVFLLGDDKLTDGALQALGPQRAAWNTASSAAISDAVIMMVDDELLNIEMTEAFLAEAGYRRFVFTADSRQALSLMHSLHPGVLLLDLSMPHVSGLEILAAMRDDAQLRHLPVIVLTSTTDTHVKLQALSSGAMDFLSKPVDPSELALRIRNTLAASAYRNFLASHDQMTGVANKVRFREELASVLETARAGGHGGALIHIGVDRLGPVNDALGRAVGDQVIQRLAKRLTQCVETELGGDLGLGMHSPGLFRFDGDEFAVLVPQVEAQDVFAAFINRLTEAAAFPFTRGGQELFVTCSMGIAVFPQDGREVDEIVTNAGLALRQAKESGRNGYEFFSQRFNKRAADRLGLGVDLRRAFARGEVTMQYQPIVDTLSGKMVAAEAVAHWQHPSGRSLMGDELVSVAGTSDTGKEMAGWSVEQVVDHMRKWSAAGLELVPVGVTMSLAHVQPRDVISLVRQAGRAGMKKGQLTLQLQQVQALDQLSPPEVEALSRIREAGIGLSLARFGAGPASLVLLRRLPWDEVKLDGSLLANLDQRGGPELVRGVLAMLQTVGITSVACGVDDMRQLALLKNHQCSRAQGKLVSPPLSGMDFAVKWLARRGKGGAEG